MRDRATILADIRARRAMLRLIKGRLPRRRPLPRQLQPDGIRLSYFRALLDVLASARALLSRSVPRLAQLVDRSRAARLDAAHLDAEGDGEDVNEIIDGLADQFFREFTNTRLAELAEAAARQTSTFSRQQVARQFQAGLGIDVLRTEPWLEQKVKAFTTENVALIKSIPQRYFTDIEKKIVASMREGLRWEEIAKDLDDRFEVAEGHAKLVARDQVGKFMGELNQARQQDLGVTKFIWRTAQDNRVRESHMELEGEVFEWADPPDVDGEPTIPGQAVNFRCLGEPVLAEIYEELGAGDAA
jgi:SPP1 gp7 family putative phage head morphogenesis protein